MMRPSTSPAEQVNANPVLLGAACGPPSADDRRCARQAFEASGAVPGEVFAIDADDRGLGQDGTKMGLVLGAERVGLVGENDELGGPFDELLLADAGVA